jgi:hypothetical protein
MTMMRVVVDILSPPSSILGRFRPPNMGLQRTRRLAAAQFLRFAGCRSAFQALSIRRSPLTVVALGGFTRSRLRRLSAGERGGR